MPAALVVEDCPERDAELRRRLAGYAVTIVRSYDEALVELHAATFDIVSLDYDLGGPNGNDVAMFLAGLPVPRRPHAVIVHSMNPVGAQRILRTLETAGISTVYRPFGS